MKKTIKLFIAYLVIGISSHLDSWGQTATFNGVEDLNWHNPSNWVWSDGSTGVPNQNTDVVIPYESSEVEIFGDSIASCKNLTGVFFEINLYDNGILKIFGDVTGDPEYVGFIDAFPFEDGDEDDIENFNGVVEFLGEGDQNVSNMGIFIGHGKINKPSGNLILNENSQLAILRSFEFQNDPVSVGAESIGNLIINGGLFVGEINITFTLPTYSFSQIPPHIVINQAVTETDDFYKNLLALGSVFDEDFEAPITNPLYFPIGASTKSFNPITIESAGTPLNNIWSVYSKNTSPTNCNSTFNSSVSSQITWYVNPMNAEGSLTEIEEENSYPVKLTFEYNASNVGNDVLTDYYDDDLKMFIEGTMSYCESVESTFNNDGSIRRVVLESNKYFNQFNIGSTIPASLNENIPNQDLQLFPNPAMDQIHFKLDQPHHSLTMEIYNVEGKRVLIKNYSNNELNTLQTLDLKEFAAGNYFIKFSADNFSINKTFVKQ